MSMLMKECSPFPSFGYGLLVLLLCIDIFFFDFSNCCITVLFFFCKAEALALVLTYSLLDLVF